MLGEPERLVYAAGVSIARLVAICLGCVSLMSCGGSDGPRDADEDSRPDSADCAPANANAWQSLPFRSRDADADGFRADSAGSICAGASVPAGYFADAAPVGSVDCDDADRTRWANLAFESRDQDGDQHRVAESGTRCAGAALPAGFFADVIAGADVDCDDADAAVWINVDYAGRDRDADGHLVNEAGQLCHSGTTLPAGYATQVPVPLTDCDDADVTRWRMVSVYRDLDGDGVGSGTRLMQCHGAAPGTGLSLSGYDPNDDAADPGAVTVSDTDLPVTLLMVVE